ncbi:MAG: OmpA family protein [bacterium]
MKTKLFLTIFSLIFTCFTISANTTDVTASNTTNAEEQSSVDNVEDSNNGTTATVYNKWSIAFSAGAALIDSDQSQNAYSIIPNSDYNFAFSGRVEYAINPIFSVFTQYSYLPYSGSKGGYDFSGLSHEVTLNGSFDILNVFNYINKKPKWKFNVNVGAGVGMYDGTLTNTTTNTETTNDNAYSFVMPVGFSLEYSPINPLGIFLDTRYTIYKEDDLDCLVSGNSNDHIMYAGLGLRYIIGAKKSTTPVQFMPTSEYLNSTATSQSAQNQQEIENINSQIDDLTELINNSVVPNVDKLKKESSENNLDSDGDGVPDSRDRHPNTPAGSFVNYYGEPLDADKINKILGQSGNARNGVPSVYFNTNETALTAIGENIVVDIAKDMFNDSNLKLQIVGYCDNTGTEAYNTELSIKRSENIKNILVKKYGIAESRITIIGKGKVESEKKSLTLNRRCDLILSK